MSTTTQASAPSSPGAQASRAAGPTRRLDPPHSGRNVPRELLAWTDYVQPSFANWSPVVPAPRSTAPWPYCAAPNGTAADPRYVSRTKSSQSVSPQPVLPAPERDRDVRTGLYRQRFYPEQWRRLQQPAIDRLVREHSQRLQWVGWERSLPQLYLPAGHLTEVILGLLQLILRRTRSEGASAGDGAMVLRVGWQSGVTHTLVLVLEHPRLKLPAALMRYASAPLAQPVHAPQEPAEADVLLRVRSLLRTVGGSLTASRVRGGGTQFRLSVPTDDRMTLVRAWLEQAAQNAIPAGTVAPRACDSPAEKRTPDAIVYQSPVSMFVVGRRHAETLSALTCGDVRLQSLASSGDFVYRAARSRWLWLTMHGELPSLDSSDGWQWQLVGRWNCLLHAGLLSEQQTAAFHGLARAIVAKMDLVLGRRVPPLDTLAAPVARTRHFRVDRPAASMPPRPTLLGARTSSSARVSPASARVSLARGSLGSTPPSMRRRRWRYPI